MINFFIPTEFKRASQSDIDLRYRSKVLVSSIFIVSASVLILCILRTLTLGELTDPVNSFFYLSVFLYLVLPFYLKKTGDYFGTAQGWILMASFGVPIRIVTSGGFDSPIMPWFGMISVASVFFVGKRFGLLILSIIFVEIAVIEFVDWPSVIPFQVYPFPGPVKVLGSFFAYFSFTYLVWLAEKERKDWKAQWQTSVAHITASSKLATLGEMAGGIAHEINSPLAVISLASSQSQMLIGRESIQKELLMKNINMISSTCERIAKVVSGLRFFARDGSDDPYEKVNLKELIQDTISLCHLKFANHNVHLYTDDIDSDLYIECKPVQISQVLLNLLNNAFDAVANQKEKWIRIVSKVENGKVIILVTDSGSGVTEEVQKRMFEPFFSTKAIGRGTGLGLSISLGITRAHNGDLQLEAGTPNTTLKVTLPISQSAQIAA